MTVQAIYEDAVRIHRAGEVVAAERIYRQILQQQPRFARAWHLLGVALHQQGDAATAIDYIQRAIALEANNGVFFGNLGAVLRSVGRLAESEAALRQAIALAPNFAGALSNLGLVLNEQNRCTEALVYLDAALEIAPQDVHVLRSRGFALGEIGLVDESVAAYQAAAACSNDPIYRVLAATQLPLVYESAAHMLAWRERLKREVERLVAEGVVVNLDEQQATPVFCLAHQGLNDLEIQRSIARLYRPGELVELAPRRPDGRRIHVGFISSYFCHHTIGKLMRGVFERLDRSEFYVTIFSIGQHQDAIAQQIAACADQYIVLSRDLASARRAVAAAGVEILFYSDIGMDQTTYSLAFSRLAPVQCVTWGHPDTTGMETMDYFLSSELIDTPTAQAHFSEKLVRMPSLNFVYSEAPLPSVLSSRSYFELSDDDHLYVCPQSIYKFHPEFDEILAGILRGDPQGKIVLIRWIYDESDELLRQRFAHSMPDVADRVQFIRRLQPPEFMNLLQVSDVLLDPIHYGGGNSSLEGFSFGVPIVTLASEFLRGRITQAFYQQMGVTDCIASDAADYTRRALKLGTDAAYRNEIKQRILEAKSRLFQDARAVRDLESFFRQVVEPTA